MINHLIGPISSAGSLLQCAWADFTIKQWNWCGLQCKIPINFLYKDWWWSWKWYALHRYQSDPWSMFSTSYPLGSTVGANSVGFKIQLSSQFNDLVTAAWYLWGAWSEWPLHLTQQTLFGCPAHGGDTGAAYAEVRLVADELREIPLKKSMVWKEKLISNDLHIPNSLKYLQVPLKTPEIQSWFQRQETKRLSGLVCILAGQLWAQDVSSLFYGLCGSTHRFFEK